MGMSAQGQDEATAIDAGTESDLQQSEFHRLRHMNFFASPLLRLPTELTLEIFDRAIQPQDDDDDDDNDLEFHFFNWPFIEPLPSPKGNKTSLLLTAICHRLREIGIAAPHLWGHADLDAPLLAKLFLERCNYDPHTITITSLPAKRHSENLRCDLLSQLEARTLNNFRSLAFNGDEPGFTKIIIPLLQSATNVMRLDLYYTPFLPADVQLPWVHSSPILHNLRALHLYHFIPDWASPLLRNLRQVTLKADPRSPFCQQGSVKGFLAALGSCPDLEELILIHVGPDLQTQDQDVVVQLRRLRGIYLEFRDPSVVEFILSHIEYPESVELAVDISVDGDTDLAEAISRVVPQHTIQAVQRSPRSTTLDVELGDGPAFFTEIFYFRFQDGSDPWDFQNAQLWLQFASKIMETIRRDTIVSITIQMESISSAEEILKEFLHGLPHLEKIDYYPTGVEGYHDSVDPFISVFSRPFEGCPVCPKLQDLVLNWKILTMDSSVSALKRALEEREASGVRLKRMGFGDVGGDGRLLEPFRDLVDEIC